MISTKLMWVNVSWYGFLALAAAFDSRWPVVLYWMGAALLTVGIIWGTK